MSTPVYTPPSDAVQLPINQPDGAFKAANTMLWFKIVVDTTGIYTFSTTGSPVDTYMGLYGPTGALIAYDDDSGGNLASQISTYLTADTYYVGVKGYDGNGATAGFGMTDTTPSATIPFIWYSGSGTDGGSGGSGGSGSGAPLVANADFFTISENAGATQFDLSLNDVFDQSAVFHALTQPTKGTLVFPDSGSGVFTYTPNVGATGPDTFNYEVYHVEADASSAQVTITITPISPVAGALSTSINQAHSYTGNLATNSTLVAGENHTFTAATQPSFGQVTVNADGTFTYTPTSSYSGPDSFTYTIMAQNGLSSTGTVSFTIVAAAPPPPPPPPPSNVPVLSPIYLVPTLGEFGLLPDGAIINIGGTGQSTFTVGGKALLFADGSTTDGSGGAATAVTLQTAYNASQAPATINLTSGKSLVVSALNNKAFSIDAATGDVHITGNLIVDGSTSVVTDTETNTAKLQIHQSAGNYVPFLIEPKPGITPTVNLVDIKVASGGSSVFSILPNGTTFIQNLTAPLVNGIDITALANKVNAHTDLAGTAIDHTAIQVSFDPTHAAPITGTTVQSAIEELATEIEAITVVASSVKTHEHVQNSASALWTIAHNQNSKRIQITVWDNTDEVIYADTIQIVDFNSVTISFNTPVAGRAILILF